MKLAAEKKSEDLSPQTSGVVTALPFIELDTVLKAVKMLRTLPDQSVLDNFNRRKPN